VNLARIAGDDRADLITFERGAGLTEACGTGAASTAFVGMRTKGLREEATIALRHGSLLIRTDKSEAVTMTGPSQRITKGIYYGSDGDH
jgi:diaminopimelate epimerase